jgi:hypothetical protein
MRIHLAVLVTALLAYGNAGAADKLEHSGSGWSVYSSVDRMSDKAECYAKTKQGLYMWSKASVYAPIQLYSTSVQYRYGQREPEWKSLDFEESKHRLVELSVYRPGDEHYRSGNVAEYNELRVESEHVFGKKVFSRFSLAGATEALLYVRQCREKYKVDDLYSSDF